MMSPTFFPGKSSFIPQEIAAIRDEITLIDAHRTEHMDGTKVRHAEKSCRYCQQYFPKEQPPAASNNPEVGRAPINVVNNLERTVDLSGKKGQITVPRSWVGKKVRVTLV